MNEKQEKIIKQQIESLTAKAKYFGSQVEYYSKKLELAYESIKELKALIKTQTDTLK